MCLSGPSIPSSDAAGVASVDGALCHVALADAATGTTISSLGQKLIMKIPS